MDIINLLSGVSVSRFVELLRSIYMSGAYSYDPMCEPEPEEPTDGELLGMIVDFFGGADAVFADKEKHEDLAEGDPV